MRSRTFSVPADLMVEFAEVVIENGLAASIEDYDSEEDEVSIEVDYEASQKKLMHQLQDKIDDYNEEEEDEEGEEDEDDD
jgi:hypothetical protein